MVGSFQSAFLPAYHELLNEADRWFAGAAAACGDRVHCRRGCDACCRGLFDISPLDVALVADGVLRLDADLRQMLVAGARRVLAAIAAVEPAWGPPWVIGGIGTERFDALCDALADEPCAALGPDGSCLVYEHRPLICRLHGLPMFDTARREHIGGECPLNDVAPSDAETTLALQFDHGAFEDRELALIARAAGPGAASDPEAFGSTVAAVVIGVAE